LKGIAVASLTAFIAAGALVAAGGSASAEQMACDTVRHYAKTYTVAQMESWARAQRYSEATIQAAKACLRGSTRSQGRAQSS
jgi:hypothetical protein